MIFAKSEPIIFLALQVQGTKNRDKKLCGKQYFSFSIGIILKAGYGKK
jgi:hypothetical protein